MLTKNRTHKNEHIYFNRILSRPACLSLPSLVHITMRTNKDDLIFSICDQSDGGIKLEEIEF